MVISTKFYMYVISMKGCSDMKFVRCERVPYKCENVLYTQGGSVRDRVNGDTYRVKRSETIAMYLSNKIDMVQLHQVWHRHSSTYLFSSVLPSSV